MAIQLSEKAPTVSQQVITTINSVYRPEFQYLTHIEENYPVAEGCFTIPKKSFINMEYPGLTGVSSVLLMNQAVISYIATGLIEKKISGLEDFDLSTDEIFEFGNNTVITNYTAKFKKTISNTQPLTFTISIDTAKNMLKRAGLIYIKGTLNLCDNSHIINYSGALCKNKMELYKD